MASILFSQPRTREFTAAGTVLAGAKLYFYTTGTTTPLTVYQDATLSTPHANPIVADSGGLFPQIWLNVQSSYDVTLKTEDDETVWTVNEVQGGNNTTLALVSSQSAEPYTGNQVVFSEPSTAVKGAVGYSSLTNNSLNVLSFEDAAVKLSTGVPGDPLNYLLRVSAFGDATVGYLGIHSNAAVGGATLRFMSQDEATTRGLIGFASTSDSTLDITNSVAGGGIEIGTAATGGDIEFKTQTIIRQILSAAAAIFRAVIHAPNGTNAAPSISFESDPDTGIYRALPNILSFATDGASRMEVNDTGSVRFVPLASAPTGPQTGDVYYDSGTNKLRVYNGGWVDLH